MSPRQHPDHGSPISGIADQGCGENVACCFVVLVITHLNKQCCKHLPRRSQDQRTSGDFFPLSFSLALCSWTNFSMSAKAYSSPCNSAPQAIESAG